MCYFKLEDVSYKYPLEDREILKNINLDIKKGEFITIVGKSGCGKSTLLKLISGMIPLTSGEILINKISSALE